jgi:Lrp/AsnC family leucine-responsive transcriptional regulator
LEDTYAVRQPIEFDAIDWRILRTLQRDGRMANNRLAEAVSLSPSPCLARVRSLEERGVIQNYVALLDPAAVGLAVNVFVQVTPERQVQPNLKAFEKAVAERPEVMECYLMTGTADYLLRVVVADLQEFESFVTGFLARVQGIGNIQSSFALKQVKYETALPLRDVEG